jgi:hypothetical protein
MPPISKISKDPSNNVLIRLKSFCLPGRSQKAGRHDGKGDHTGNAKQQLHALA